MDDSRSAPVSVPRVNTGGPDPLIGRLINDRYKIVGVIARGGMGKVYRAEQSPLGRLVALKVLNPNYSGENDPEFHKRFFLEASIASKLTHPNTVTIFDYGKTDDDVYYIAMELLEGRTLHRALREEGPFDPERTMHVAKQVCRSLREAHGLGVIHRDLKPANIYLVQHGDENDFVKVLDFGLVKNLDEKGEELTQAGLFMGSPKYMSPEQIRGERVDSRVDVYALGVIMYEMLTGKVPFDRPNSVNILMAHIQEDVPPMTVMNPNVKVPPVYEDVVHKCMAKTTAERFANMDEVLAAIKKAAAAQVVSGDYRVPGVDSLRSVPALSPSSPLQVRAQAELLTSATPPVAIKAQAAPSRAPSPEARDRKLMPILIVIAAAVLFVEVLLLRGRNQADRDASEQMTPPPSAASATASQPASAATGSAPTPTVSALGPKAGTDPAVVGTPVLHTVLVSLKSTPPGAMVAIGSREYGPTPTQVELTGEEAELGRTVTFRFQRKGYRDLTVVGQVQGDRLDVEAPPMDPIPVRRPAREPEGSKAPVGAPAPGATPR